MSYVIAIDVGIKNLGLCVFDFKTAKVVYWDNVSLVHNGKYVPSLNVQYVMSMVAKLECYFANAFQVIVERQMRCNMRIIEAILETMYYGKCLILSARSVKMHYGLSMKNYRLNKQKAVQWTKQFVTANPSAFADSALLNFSKASKQDDLADCLLMCMYYLDTYSNQLTGGIPSYNV